MTDEEQLEIRQAFAVESAELLSEMESALLSLEADIGNADEINRLFRAVHTIKGSAGIVSCEPLEQFCHSIEHLLVRIREHTLDLEQPLIALLLTCHDHIRGMVEQFGNATSALPFSVPEIHAALLSQLASWRATPDSGGGTEKTYGLLHPSYFDSEAGNPSALIDFTKTAAGKASAGSELQQSKTSVDQSRSSLRVDAAKLDQLSNLIIELMTASSVLESQVRRLGDIATIESTAHITSLVTQIQEKSMIFRMLPVQTLFRRFQRIVHDTGKASNKEICLLISGGETELDKAVEEKLYDPLLHLVRNAVDHGIEAEQERIARGKPAAGTIHLKASQDSGNIVICVSDDGQGIPVERVTRKGIELGLLKKDTESSLREVLNCIFEPGFSTLDEATTLSGRGVGMNVVKKTIDALRGRIEIDTEQGVGTTFKISIPLSLSLVDGFMVAQGDGLFIMPMDLVQETIELPDISLAGVMTNGCLLVRGHSLPCLDLKTILAVPDAPTSIRHVVVIRYEGQRVGLIVDQLLGNLKAVIKPLGPMFRKADCVSGASILGDGTIALFLEMDRLISSTVAS